MNRKISIIFSVLLPFLSVSCLQEKGLDAPAMSESNLTTLQQKTVNSADDAIEGTLILLLSESAASVLENGQELPALEGLCESTGAVLSRVFPGAASAEEKKFRLDRWYCISFPEDLDVTAVAEKYAELAEVEVVQYNTGYNRNEGSEATEWTPGENTVSPVLPFNDPKLIDQWHYINNGDLSVASSVRVGADINVANAWSLTTGDPAIIVAVCDEGV